MNFSLRQVNLETDYPLISEWFMGHDIQPLPKHALSTSGFIVEADLKPLCAIWVYTTNSSLALVRCGISDPKSNKESRNKGLDTLLDHVVKWSKEQGIDALFLESNIPNVLKRAERHGFNITGSNMTHTMRRL